MKNIDIYKYEFPKNFPICKTEDFAFCEECFQDEDCSDECNCRCLDYTPYSDEQDTWKEWFKQLRIARGLKQKLGFEVGKN